MLNTYSDKIEFNVSTQFDCTTVLSVLDVLNGRWFSNVWDNIEAEVVAEVTLCVKTSWRARLGIGLDTLNCITDGRDSFVNGLKMETRRCWCNWDRVSGFDSRQTIGLGKWRRSRRLISTASIRLDDDFWALKQYFLYLRFQYDILLFDNKHKNYSTKSGIFTSPRIPSYYNMGKRRRT